MSTIKSSSEDLTLNADGTGRNIKFQSNGVEKASISSAGALTAISTINAGSVGSSGGVRGKINFGGVSGVADGFTITNQNGNYLDIKPNSTNSGIKILNSGGLCFGTDTATANALDDYEEGTWTGTIGGSTGDPTTPISATGYYIKIGRQVSVYFGSGSKVVTGASGTVQIRGLPFSNNYTYASFGHTETKYYDYQGCSSAGSYISGTTINFYCSGDTMAVVPMLFVQGGDRYLRTNISYITS